MCLYVSVVGVPRTVRLILTMKTYLKCDEDNLSVPSDQSHIKSRIGACAHSTTVRATLLHVEQACFNRYNTVTVIWDSCKNLCLVPVTEQLQ